MRRLPGFFRLPAESPPRQALGRTLIQEALFPAPDAQAVVERSAGQPDHQWRTFAPVAGDHAGTDAKKPGRLHAGGLHGGEPVAESSCRHGGNIKQQSETLSPEKATSFIHLCSCRPVRPSNALTRIVYPG